MSGNKRTTTVESRQDRKEKGTGNHEKGGRKSESVEREGERERE